jgi:formylglycine-generating enzyme required for sulfatase activity
MTHHLAKTRTTWARRFGGLLALIATLFLAASPASADDSRIALVIGNSKYPDATAPLRMSVKDATKLAEEFRRLNFNVDLELDLGKEKMQRAVDDFTAKVKNGSTALFYFSGFGLQVARRTYLIPVNAQIWTEADVRRDGVSLDALLSELQRKGADVKIIIIDAAHRNPYERRFRASPAGLSPIEAPTGTLVLYSTAPGKLIEDKSKGATSIFAGELVKELKNNGLTAEEIFNHTRLAVSRASRGDQVPWVASSLLEEFKFGAKRSGVAVNSQSSPFPPAPKKPESTRPQYSNDFPPAKPVEPAKEPASEQASLSPARQPTSGPHKPGDVFRDCAECPELVALPAGTFEMGSSKYDHEKPVHQVRIPRPFAIGTHEVTFAEWDQCVKAKACKFSPGDRGWGRAQRPVINVSWTDAKEYTTWLSHETGQTYRLPSEAEWEYAARGGTETPFWWGRSVGTRLANCRECSTGKREQTLPVGTYKANAFGLFDTAGNAAEWASDCWNTDYRGAPSDGSAWLSGNCRLRVLRGGSFDSNADYIRSDSRFRYDADVRYSANGFRVVRELR